MNIPSHDELLERLKGRITDPERQDLVASIAIDFVELSTLALTDPEAAERRARHLKAQVSGLAATEIGVLSAEVTTWIMSVVSTLVRSAIVVG